MGSRLARGSALRTLARPVVRRLRPRDTAAPAPDASPEAAALQREVDAVGYWYHSIAVGHGVVTPGVNPLADHEAEAAAIAPLAGKSVIDIGAYDGFYSFHAERQGARRVVALDHFVWSLDLPRHIAYWEDCKRRGVAPDPYEQTDAWDPAGLPGKRGFDTAHRLLGSSVEAVVGNFMEMDLAPLGIFDVALFLGVLYHLEDPMRALRRVASLTSEVAYIETAGIDIPRYRDDALVEFYESGELNHDVSNWWAPNLRALTGMCRAAGFSRVEPVGPAPRRRLRGARTRLFVRAWKQA